MHDETAIGGDGRSFQPTAWTQILQAQAGSESTVIEAMNRLIERYWKPVYFHIRRRGRGVEDAKDLAQQFFARFTEKKSLMTVSPDKGKFRTFLLVSLDRFLADDYDKRNAQKRTLNTEFQEAHPKHEDAADFERDWAMVVLDRAFESLKSISPREAKVVEAQRLGKTTYKSLAEELGTTEANVKVLAHRARKKLRGLILEELRDTVSQPGQEYEELQALFKAFSA